MAIETILKKTLDFSRFNFFNMNFWLNIPFFGNFREHVAKLFFELFSGLKFELCHKMEVTETQIAREREREPFLA